MTPAPTTFTAEDLVGAALDSDYVEVHTNTDGTYSVIATDDYDADDEYTVDEDADMVFNVRTGAAITAARAADLLGLHIALEILEA